MASLDDLTKDRMRTALQALSRRVQPVAAYNIANGIRLPLEEVAA